MSLVKSSSRLILILGLCLAATMFIGSTADAGQDSGNFKWVYHYDASLNEGELTVTIYDETCKVEQNEFVFPSACKVHNDHIACEVDIQGAANDGLAQEGYDRHAGAAETYPLIFAEVVGELNGGKSGINGTIIEHPSIVYNIQSTRASGTRFTTNWTGVTARSDFFGHSPKTPYAMRTDFGKNKFFHSVDGSHISDQVTTASQLPFRLDQTTFKIFQPKGFKLDNFTIDPPRCGFG